MDRGGSSVCRGFTGSTGYTEIGGGVAKWNCCGRGNAEHHSKKYDLAGDSNAG